ncbi:MAG: DUF6585 family protein [Chloroflexota bacterium]
MSDKLKRVERDDATSIYDPDPVLGKYVSHHPSNRLLLLIRAGIFYAIAVVVLQLIFFTVPDEAAAIFLPIAFAGIAGIALWYTLHHWNREVVLYERGFTFRQGSDTAYILYANVVKLMQNIEVIGGGSFKRRFFDYKLITDVDEVLPITNVYSNPDKLTRLLERAITRDRLQIMQEQLSRGEEVALAENFKLTPDGILLPDKELFWRELADARVKQGHIIIASTSDEAWHSAPTDSFDNPMLALAALKSMSKRMNPANTQAVVQSDEV